MSSPGGKVVCGAKVPPKESWSIASLGKSAVDAFYSSPSPSSTKDTILFSRFQNIPFDSEMAPCLLVGYNNGFQVWDLRTIGVNLEVHEIVSRQWSRVNHIVALEPPKGEQKGDRFFGKRPVLAIVSGEDASHTHPSNCVVFYSLVTDQTFYRLEFDTAVVSVASNSTHVVVSTRAGTLHVLDARNLNSLMTIPTVTHPEYGAVFALGSRWLAYQTASPLEDSADQQNAEFLEEVLSNSTSRSGMSPSHGGASIKQPQSGNASPNGASSSGSASDASAGSSWLLGSKSSKDIVELTNKGIKKAMYYGTKTVEATIASISGAASGDGTPNFTGGSSPPSSVNFSPANSGMNLGGSGSKTDRPGLVQVIDLYTKETLSHFKADSEILTTISFDPSGSLLLTGSNSGQELVVWRISPCGKPLQSHRKLYVLVRGISLNQVRDSCWLNDSSLVAFTSRTNGTTHVFPIRPIGGDVSAATHLSRNLRLDVFSKMQQPIPVVSPAKLANIHSELKSPQKNGFAGTAILVPRHSPRKKDRVAMCYHFGIDGSLVRHDIEMKPADNAPAQLAANLVSKYRWDLCRTTKGWPEVRFKPTAPVPSSSQLHSAVGVSLQPSIHHLDFAAGFGNADQESLLATQILANAEIETSDSRTADKPFWQSSIFGLVAWTEAPQGLKNDIANVRPHLDDPNVRNGRKAELLLQNDAAYSDHKKRVIPRPQMVEVDKDIEKKLRAANSPMSGRKVSNVANNAGHEYPDVIIEKSDDEDMEDRALVDKRVAAHVVPEPAQPPQHHPLKPDIIVHSQPLAVASAPDAAPAHLPVAPAPVAAAPAAAPAKVAIPKPAAPAVLVAPVGGGGGGKKKKRKEKMKELAVVDDHASNSAESSGEPDISQSTFLLKDALM